MVGSRTGAHTLGGGFPVPRFRLWGGFTIPPSSRFQLPPRQTQHADVPHCAFLRVSCGGLWDLSPWERFRLRPPHPVVVQQPQGVIQPPPPPPLPAEALAVPCTHSTTRTVQPSPSHISSVAGLADSWAPLSSRPCLPFVGGVTNSRVPSLHRHSPASPLLRTPPPPSHLQSLSRGLRFYDVPCSLDFAMGRGGLLQLHDTSLSPCCRFHPAGVTNRTSQVTIGSAVFAFTGAGSTSRASHFRGHYCVRLRCGPVTRSHPEDGLVDGLQKFGFPPPCHPSYKAPDFSLGGTDSR